MTQTKKQVNAVCWTAGVRDQASQERFFRDNVGKNPLAEDAVAFEDVDHLPDARDVLRGTGFEPTDPQAKLVTFQGGGFSRFSLNHARSLFSSSASERVMFCHSSCAAV
jgi:hypothetical protein